MMNLYTDPAYCTDYVAETFVYALFHGEGPVCILRPQRSIHDIFAIVLPFQIQKLNFNLFDTSYAGKFARTRRFLIHIFDICRIIH
jgi:hypothetical protein